MNKLNEILLLLFFLISFNCFSQFASDGSYLWNLTSLTYSANKKTEFVFFYKNQFNNQIGRLDYYHFDLTVYRKLNKDFAVGLGVRQTESYKSATWNPGNTLLLYGVYYLNTRYAKIKFVNRVTSNITKIADTQYGLDNMTSFDFFVHSTSKIPKPYLLDEIFSNINQQKVQTFRLYGGFHLIEMQYLAVDLFYCYQKTHSSWVWKEYNVFGIKTKLRI